MKFLELKYFKIKCFNIVNNIEATIINNCEFNLRTFFQDVLTLA